MNWKSFEWETCRKVALADSAVGALLTKVEKNSRLTLPKRSRSYVRFRRTHNLLPYKAILLASV